MRYRSTLILFVIAAVAVAYFMLVEQPRHRRESQHEREGQRLSTIDPNTVVRLEVTHGDTTITLRRHGDAWSLTTPVQDRAEAVTANVLLYTMGNATVDRVLSAAADRISSYGLQTPQTKVACTTARGDHLELLIGDYNPDRSDCYVRRGDDEAVLMVTAGLKRSAERPLFDFRDKRVAIFEVVDVSHFTVSAPSGLTWYATGGRPWFTVVGGDTIRGDGIEVEGILRELRAMRGTRIVDPPNQGALISQPVGKITVHLRPDSTIVFAFGSEADGECPVSVSGETRTVYVAADVLGIFRRSLHQLRFRNALVFDATRLGRITLEANGGTTSIHRAGKTWAFANPTMGTVAPGALSSLIESLRNLKYREILIERLGSPPPHGLDMPVFRLTLADSAGTIVDVLEAAEPLPVRQVCYATSRSSGCLALIDAEPLAEVRRLFESFRAR